MAAETPQDGARPSQAHYVVGRFGKAKDVVDNTRFTSRQVYHWLSVGSIPEANWIPLMIDAHRARVALSPLDFVAHLVDAIAEARVTGEIMSPTFGESPASSALPA